MSVNKIMLLGRVGQTPVLKATPSGTSVCNFSIATSRTFTDKQGNKQETTQWHKIVVWGKQAENCGNYLGKGKQVFIEGEQTYRSFENKEGQKITVGEVIAARVQFLGDKKQEPAYQPGHIQEDNWPKKEVKLNGAPPSAKDATFKIDVNQTFTQDDIPF